MYFDDVLPYALKSEGGCVYMRIICAWHIVHCSFCYFCCKWMDLGLYFKILLFKIQKKVSIFFYFLFFYFFKVLISWICIKNVCFLCRVWCCWHTKSSLERSLQKRLNRTSSRVGQEGILLGDKYFILDCIVQELLLH